MSYPITVESDGRSYVISNPLAGLFAPRWAKQAAKEQEYVQLVNSYINRAYKVIEHPNPAQMPSQHQRSTLEIIVEDGIFAAITHKRVERKIIRRNNQSYRPQFDYSDNTLEQMKRDITHHQTMVKVQLSSQPEHHQKSSPITVDDIRNDDSIVRQAITASVLKHLTENTPLSFSDVGNLLYASSHYNCDQHTLDDHIRRFRNEQKDLLKRLKNNQPVTTAYEQIFK